MKTYLVDDEQSSIKVLQNLLLDYPEIKVVGCANGGEKALEDINRLQPDLLFLDIELGSMLSFQLLENLNYTNFQIIFISAFEHYALQAVKFCAIDYLLKPIDMDELAHALKNAVEKWKGQMVFDNTNSLLDHIKSQEKNLHKLALPFQGGYNICELNDIEYCCADGNYTEFYECNGQKTVVSRKIKHYENLLREKEFIRIHNSYLINLNHLKTFNKSDGGHVTMASGKQLSVSQSRKQQLLDMLIK